MVSMELRPEELTALTAGARGGYSLIKRWERERTTTSSPVTPSTQNITPSFKQALRPALEQPSTPQISRASSVPTSSNMQRLGGSLFLVEYKTIEGDRARTFEIKEDAIASFKEFNKLYRIVTLSEEKTTTSKTVLRDSQNPGA
ncbi:MAG TPA: hypothetical protein VIY48_15575 [Candidatus Paceibacterota bacterium]